MHQETNYKQSSFLSVWSVLRNSSKVSVANLMNALVLFPVNIIVARELGPESYGVVGYVTLWQLYASWAKPGIFTAAYREMPGLLAQGRKEASDRIQNIGMSGEGTCLLLPITIIVTSAFLHGETVFVQALVVGALVFAICQVRDLVASVHWAHQRFELIARINVVATLSTAVFLLGTVWWLNLYAALMAPAVTALTVLIGLQFWAPSICFQFDFNRGELWRLIKMGLPLSMLTISYWGFRAVDRTAVASWLTIQDLGYFTFVMQFVNLAILVVSDFGNVLQPALWAELGRRGNQDLLGTQLRRFSLAIVITACAGTNVLQAGFAPFVYWFVPRYEPALQAFEIMSFLLVAATASFVSVHVLTSPAVNRQRLLMAVYALGVPVHLALAFLVIWLGWGLGGVAFISVCAQAMVSLVLLLMARQSVLSGRSDPFRLDSSLLVPIAVCVAVFGLYNTEALSFSIDASLIEPLALRLSLTFLVWGSIFYLWFWRESTAFRFRTG